MPRLEQRLARMLEGEVRFDSASRALYASDASNFRQPPLGVVVPRSIDDVVATHAVRRELGAPITSQGGGTSLSGGRDRDLLVHGLQFALAEAEQEREREEASTGSRR